MMTLPPPGVVLWNHRVGGKLDFDLCAAMRCGENLENKSGFKVSRFQSFTDLLLIEWLPIYFGQRFARPAPRREARAGLFPASQIVKEQKGLRVEGMGFRIPVPDDRPKQSPRGPKVRGGQPHVVARLGSQKR